MFKCDKLIDEACQGSERVWGAFVNIWVSVPFRAFWGHVGESFLRFGVWDGNDVLVKGSHHLLNVCLVPEAPGVLVVGIREVGESDLGRGTERRVGDRKRRGEARFGARHCGVVALQERFIDLAVFLLDTAILWFNHQVEDSKNKTFMHNDCYLTKAYSLRILQLLDFPKVLHKKSYASFAEL